MLLNGCDSIKTIIFCVYIICTITKASRLITYTELAGVADIFSKRIWIYPTYLKLQTEEPNMKMSKKLMYHVCSLMRRTHESLQENILYVFSKAHTSVGSIFSSLSADPSVRKCCVGEQRQRLKVLSLAWQWCTGIMYRLHRKYRSFWPGSRTWRVTAKVPRRPGQLCSDGQGPPKTSLCPALLTTGPPRSLSTRGSVTRAEYVTRLYILHLYVLMNISHVVVSQSEKLCGYCGPARGRAPVQVLCGRSVDLGSCWGEWKF